MGVIRDYVNNHLIEPFKNYNSVMQDTMIELIIQMLEELYDLTLAFPNILSPDYTRLDIMRVIADQFLFNIRDEAKLEEQAKILSNILYVYNKRGSIDTIENMWKYYGGDLPKEVKVIIPSYNLFRYSISPFSGIHVFQDGDTNRTGIYEIRLTNSTYPIPQLREFLIKELVAAGNLIYFTNSVSSGVTDSDETHYRYDILEDNLLHMQMKVFPSSNGLRFSSNSSSALSGKSIDKLSDSFSTASGLWSSKENIFVDIDNMIDMLLLQEYLISCEVFDITPQYALESKYIYDIESIDTYISLNEKLYCTPTQESVLSENNLYIKLDDGTWQRVIEKEYFILGDTLLGESLGYDIVEGDKLL